MFKSSMKPPRDIYCGRDCYEASRLNRVTKTCERCGKQFQVNGSMADRYKVCSLECRHGNAKARRRKCASCGKVFLPSTPNGRAHCSEVCRRPIHLTTCRTCGNDFRYQLSTPRQFCSIACYRRFRGENRLEAIVRRALEDLGLLYVQEQKSGRYSIDFALPGGIALEVDGSYWHRNPTRDAKKTAALEARGWRVVRIAEKDIYEAANVATLISSRLSLPRHRRKQTVRR
jgi:very-short-patch-repair endonuclease